MDRETRKSTIWIVSSDGKGKTQITGHHENFYRYLALSPDGLLLGVRSVREPARGTLHHALGRRALRCRLIVVTKQAHNEGASWSPDGKKLAFTSTRSGSFDIWVMDVDVEQMKKDLQAADRQP